MIGMITSCFTSQCGGGGGGGDDAGRQPLPVSRRRVGVGRLVTIFVVRTSVTYIIAHTQTERKKHAKVCAAIF